MLYVSLIVELLRSHPRAVFWLVTLAQAALWWVMPSLFYAAPPGDGALVLAIGHELQLGTFLGPPLAFWLRGLAFHLPAAGPPPAVEVGFLRLAPYAGLILLGPMLAFTTPSRRGRAMLGSIDPW